MPPSNRSKRKVSSRSKARRAQVKKSKQYSTLHKIMGAAGWWWYCGEPWHFEYTRGPMNGQRVAPVGSEDSPEFQAAKEAKEQKHPHKIN